jgi:hypothetical protein
MAEGKYSRKNRVAHSLRFRGWIIFMKVDEAVHSSRSALEKIK